MFKNLARRGLFNQLLPKELPTKNFINARVSHCHKASHPQTISAQSVQIRCYSSGNDGGEVRKDQASNENAFHESGAEDANFSDDDIRIKVFDCALNHVIEHGWSDRAISLGAEEAGFASVVDGKVDGNDLLMYFVRESNGKLLTYLQDNVEKYRNDKNKLIRDAIEFRLRLTIPFINVWAEAMKMMLSPKLFSESTDELSKMVDDIWCYAGDQSNDIEWFIKRGALAQLYAGLQLVMLTDRSEDYKDTWVFLDQRFKDLDNIKELSKRVEENKDNLANIIKNFSLYSSRKR